MENNIFLWYNEVLNEYSYGSQEELDQVIIYYAEDKVTILYKMDQVKISLCKKITDNLNNVRTEVA